jgi:DNA-binding NtrC family response regulator
VVAPKHKILVVDDEPSARESFRMILQDTYLIISAGNGEDCLREIEKDEPDLVLLDIKMPGIDGVEVLQRIKQKHEKLDVIMVTATKDPKIVVNVMKMGAYDYVTKPFDVEDLLNIVGRAIDKRTKIKENLFPQPAVEKHRFGNIIGHSPAIREIFKLIEKVAKNNSTILIWGESGTGKELVASAIHQNSDRAYKPFIAVNCAAIPETLLESELFGHEKGAFTHAFEKKIGKFEVASSGTIFLDEIGSMSFGMQAKLLRTLQEREIERIGGTKSIPVDVRIISATNNDLRELIRQEKFREDLYYRLNVIPINLPPLRHRKEDLPLLVDFFVEKFNRQFNRKIKGLKEAVMKLLMDYTWPGNIRELENLIERLIVLEQDEYVGTENLPLDILTVVSESPNQDQIINLRLKEAVNQFEARFIKRILEKTRGNQSEASRLLGIHRNTLLLKMKQLDLHS